MSQSKGRWSVWWVPVGPEARNTKERMAQGEEGAMLLLYQECRQREADGNRAIVLTDGRGDVVHACS